MDCCSLYYWTFTVWIYNVGVLYMIITIPFLICYIVCILLVNDAICIHILTTANFIFNPCMAEDGSKK